MSLVASGTLTVADSTLPSWVPSSVGTWAAIPGTAMSSATMTRFGPGSPDSKITAWVGHCIDTRDSKVRCVCNGGHNDYGGTEAMLLTLETNSPAWTEERACSASIQQNQQYNNDGTPSSRHSYYGHIMNETDSRVMLIGGAYYSSSGSETFNMDSYNIVAKTYNPQGTHPSIADPGSGEKYAFVRDPTNDNIFAFGGFVVRKWTRSSNTWSVVMSSGGPNCYYTGSALDTSRRRAFVIGADTFTNHDTYTIDTSPVVRTSRTMTGTAASTVAGSGSQGIVYVPSLDSFLMRLGGSGGTVYQINASTFDCSSFSTTGGSGIPATSNGPYTKFHYAPRLKCCIYTPTYTGNAWALRVEA